MIKLAFSNLACPNWSLLEVLAAAKRFGYEGVELRLLDGEVLDATTISRAQRSEIGRLFADARVPIVCVDSSIRLTAGAEQVQPALLAFLQLAHDWGSPLVRVFGGPWPEGRTEGQVFDHVAEILTRLAPAAERLGAAIAIETHDAFSRAATIAEVLKRVPHPVVGALWDTHHPHRMGETPQQVIELLGDRLLHVQVKDARRHDDGWDLVLLGEGEVPVAETVELLRQRGYDRWISVEWEKKWHPEIADAAVALPQHIEVLRKWLEPRAVPR